MRNRGRKELIFVILAFFLIFMMRGVEGFAPVENNKDENNPLAQYKNRFLEIDEGNINLEMSLPSDLPNSLVLWSGEYPKKIIFNDFKVSSSLGKYPLKIADDFLNKHKETLGLNNIELELVSSYSDDYNKEYPGGIGVATYKQVVTNPGDGKKYGVEGSFVVVGMKTVGVDALPSSSPSPSPSVTAFSSKSPSSQEAEKTFLVLYKSNVYRDTEIAEQIKPILSQEQVIQLARQYMGGIDNFYYSAKIESIDIVAYPLNKVIWAYKVIFSVNHNKVEKLEVIIDSHTGNLISYYNVLQTIEISGKVSGEIFPEHAGNIYPKYLGQNQENRAFRNNYVWINDERTQTDADGKYTFTGSEPIKIESIMEGDWAKVYDEQFERTTAMKREKATDFDINWQDYDKYQSYKQEQSNAFYHTNIVHDFAVQPHINVKEMDFQIAVYVNNIETCNAYYDDGFPIIFPPSLNFFRQGPLKDQFGQIVDPMIICEATSLSSDIIYHEYGHGIIHHIITVDFPYEGETGNLDEAIADYTACTINNNACASEGFLGEECLRRCDSDDRYPDQYSPEPHSGAQIISGALWDLREKLVEKYGKGKGISYADSLVYKALRYQPTSFLDYVESMMLADDDNSNIDDGSPHMAEICESFDKHGIVSEYCAGVADMSVNIVTIFSPKPFDTTIGIDDVADITGTVWSKKGLSVWYWELSLCEPDLKSQSVLTCEEEGFQFSHKGVGRIIRGKLASVDFSRLEVGKNYILTLDAYFLDENGKIYKKSDGYSFFKSHTLKIKVYDVAENKGTYKAISVADRTSMYSFPKNINGVCKYSEEICELEYSLLTDNADLVIFYSKSPELLKPDNLPQHDKRQYLFFKRYSYPNNIIEADTSKTKQVASNIEGIINKRGIDVTQQFETYYKSNSDARFLLRGQKFISDPSRSIEPLNLYYDLNLLFRDYQIYNKWKGVNNEDKRLIDIGYILKYPFKYEAKIDESKFKTINLKISNPFVNSGVFIYLFERPYPREGYLDSDTSGIISGENDFDYQFEFLPNINGININYIFNAQVVNYDSRTQLYKYVYNGEGFAEWDSPETLSKDINFFVNHPRLEMKEGNVLYRYSGWFSLIELLLPAAKNRYVIRGALVDESNNELRRIISHPGEGVFGRLEITLPDGSVETIDSSQGSTYGSWVIDCNEEPAYEYDGSALGVPFKYKEFLSYPELLMNRDKFCQTGEYKVDWVFGDVFKDGRILELHEKYYFDGNKFTILEEKKNFKRGDVNNNDQIEIADSIAVFNYLFSEDSKKILTCFDAADVDDNGVITIGDGIYLLNYLFSNGEKPKPPFDKLGIDETEDELDCKCYGAGC